MKQQYICALLLCFLSLTTVGASKSLVSKSRALSTTEPLTLEGWIDMDQEEGQSNTLHFSTDFKLDASAIRPDVLKSTMSEKVTVQGVFVKDAQGTLVFKIQSLTPKPTSLENGDNSDDVLESTESDLMEEGH